MNVRKIGKESILILVLLFSGQTFAGGLSESLYSQSVESNPSHTTNLPSYTQKINSSTITFQIPAIVENPYIIPFEITFSSVGSDEYVQVSTGGRIIMNIKPQGNVKLNAISSRFKGIDNSIVVSIYKNDGTIVAQNSSEIFQIKDGQRATGTIPDDGAPFEYRERFKPGVYKALMRFPNSKNRFVSQYSFETDQGNVLIEGSYLLSQNPYIEFRGDFSTAKFISMVPSHQ